MRFDTLNGRDPHECTFSIGEMNAGAVLDSNASHEAIALPGVINQRAGDAHLVLTYLPNGLIRKFIDCRAGMVRDENGQWLIVNAYHHKWVGYLVVQTWTFGSSMIEGICRR